MDAELRCDWLMASCYACRLSEQRVHDLLEGLCSNVSKGNMLYTSEEGNQTWAKSAQPGWTAPKKAEEEGKFTYRNYRPSTITVMPLRDC